MTDGIIQEVFKKYSVMNEPMILFLDTIEHELIEKIKQELYVNWLGEIQKQELLRKLIGDTK